MNFSDISKNLRKERNLSQVQLAEALNVSKACISMIEIGKNEPTANTLIRYADFFECSTDYLLGREDDFGNVVVRNERSAPQLSPEESALLETFRQLTDQNRLRVSTYTQIRLEEQDPNDKRRIF